jgi:hypothetical protein
VVQADDKSLFLHAEASKHKETKEKVIQLSWVMFWIRVRLPAQTALIAGSQPIWSQKSAIFFGFLLFSLNGVYKPRMRIIGESVTFPTGSV